MSMNADYVTAYLRTIRNGWEEVHRDKAYNATYMREGSKL